VTDKSKSPLVKYCRAHNRVWSPRTRTWKVVPADFIAEVRHADLPVDLVEGRCPWCRKPRGQSAEDTVAARRTPAAEESG
jgi:hypothetical protein